MTTMVTAILNEQWGLVLPDFRERFWGLRPNWERGRLEDCHKSFEPGMTVYDVGAEHGDMSALYKKWVGPDGNVIPIECAVACWPCIKAIFEANGFPPPPAWFSGFAADIDQYTAGDYCTGPWPQAAYDLPVREDPGFAHLAQQSDSIPCFKIDTMAKLSGHPPDVIVSDVEGAEYNVMLGAKQTLMNRDVLVYISVHDLPDSNPLLNWYGRTQMDLDALMTSYGYRGEELPRLGAGERFMRYEKGSYED